MVRLLHTIYSGFVDSHTLYFECISDGRSGQFLTFTTLTSMMTTRGFRTAHRALQDPDATAPLTFDEWFEHILVREVGLRLILGDMQSDTTATSEIRRGLALRVMAESAEYGYGLFLGE
jgi:hypothetical protein